MKSTTITVCALVCMAAIVSGCESKKGITGDPGNDAKSFRADPSKMPDSVRQANEKRTAEAMAKGGSPQK